MITFLSGMILFILMVNQPRLKMVMDLPMLLLLQITWFLHVRRPIIIIGQPREGTKPLRYKYLSTPTSHKLPILSLQKTWYDQQDQPWVDRMLLPKCWWN
uniref:Uncharacterized protein n=1 Tax=Cacopsylla melanoneura TaxID=428564 RepID=A0A8D8TUY5_9HEMI